MQWTREGIITPFASDNAFSGLGSDARNGPTGLRQWPVFLWGKKMGLVRAWVLQLHSVDRILSLNSESGQIFESELRLKIDATASQ